MKRFRILSIVCLGIMLSLTMLVSANESATDLSHQAQVWDAKVEYFRQEKIRNFMTTQPEVFTDKSDFLHEPQVYFNLTVNLQH